MRIKFSVHKMLESTSHGTEQLHQREVLLFPALSHWFHLGTSAKQKPHLPRGVIWGSGGTEIRIANFFSLPPKQIIHGRMSPIFPQETGDEEGEREKGYIPEWTRRIWKPALSHAHMYTQKIMDQGLTSMLLKIKIVLPQRLNLGTQPVSTRQRGNNKIHNL